MIEHQKYEPTREELLAELMFMYVKYEELCKAYKKMAHDLGSEEAQTVHDMSHMVFEEDIKEKGEERYGK